MVRKSVRTEVDGITDRFMLIDLHAFNQMHQKVRQGPIKMPNLQNTKTIEYFLQPLMKIISKRF